MFTIGLAGGPTGFDPLILLLAALVFEALVGEARLIFRFVPHPVRLIGGAVEFADRKLNREARSEMDRAIRGGIVALVVAAACFGVGSAVAWLSRVHPWGALVELLLLVSLVTQRGLYVRVRAVGAALDGQGLEGGRAAVAHIVGRDTGALDGPGVARAALESCAENFCDGVVAPVFCYVLFGFPGLLVYKAVNTMDSVIGYRTPRHRAFGFVAARTDDILNLIPARLAGLFLVIAAVFTPTARPGAALRVMLRDAGKHRSPNAGWTEGAMAGAARPRPCRSAHIWGPIRPRSVDRRRARQGDGPRHPPRALRLRGRLPDQCRVGRGAGGGPPGDGGLRSRTLST